jgi:hypothetical protein
MNDIDIHHGTFSIDLVALLIVCVSIVPYLFYLIRDKVPYPVKTNLKLFDYYVISILLVYLVIGVYQQYFWTKDNKIRKEIVIPHTPIDNMLHQIFGIDDSWTYIYNFIYYFIFGLVIISVKDYKHFAILILGGIALMTGLSIIWYLFPNVVESRMTPKNYFLQKTQAIDDNRNNACPSAHVVFAMYSFYLLRNVIGTVPASLFPILISISCFATTQHVSTDIILGLTYCVLFYNYVLHKAIPSIFQ